MKFESVDAALDFAIEREEESYQFYMDLSARVNKPGMSDLFKGFALEEKGHKAKIENFKKGKKMAPAAKQVMDLKISDYLVEVKPSPGMDLQEALILAMKKEKAAFRLYSDLAAAAADGDLKNAFLTLAQEEARHKLRFEILYDDEILIEG